MRPLLGVGLLGGFTTFSTFALEATGLLESNPPVALLYLVFAVGALRQDAWSWWVGLAAALLNGLLVVNTMVQGASIALSLLWAVVPLVLVSYLFAPAGRRALGGQAGR